MPEFYLFRPFFSLKKSACILSVVFGLAFQAKAQTYTMPTVGLQSTYTGTCPVATCSGIFYDNGGAGTNYAANVNAIERTFTANTPGQCLRATFTSFSMNDTYFLCFGPNSCCDYLQIFNGPNAQSPMLYNNCTTSPGTVTSTTGSLTFKFVSDGSVQLGGWAATLSCVACAGGAPANTPSDCVNATTIYGPDFFPNPSNGIGNVAEACSGCSLGETYSHWYKFTINTGGSLAFEIDPINNANNFDFALFGPGVTCGAPGSPIRCSNAAAAGTGSTGLGNGAVDASEDIAGDQWVSPLTVTAGQTYYLLVDAALVNNAGFNFIVTGTAIIEQPLPLQLTGFNGKRQNGNNYIQWETANEINTKTFELERSTDGTGYTKIASLQSAGTGNNMYVYNDPFVSANKVLYRLKIIDLSGSFTYSHIIWIDADAKSNIKIYPTPASNVVNINLGKSNLLNTRAMLYDVTGKLLNSFLIQNIQQQLDISRLSQGLYILKFEDGTAARFVKK
ncbi:MAG: T9SS type A sorting domain-containing protein [Ferruginibacter sp.]|nr:T9SS type A sorting domain-containing protein [Chitinophagaceae bacterium]